MVFLPTGGAATPLSATGRCVLQVAVGVRAVGSSGREYLRPEVLPAAGTKPGEQSCMQKIQHGPLLLF